jgi:hypothetical protein
MTFVMILAGLKLYSLLNVNILLYFFNLVLIF